MSDFAGDMKRFTEKLKKREEQLFNNVVEAVRSSIVDGSPITGAPGQPKDEGDLIESWRVEKAGRRALISTDSPYAHIIEDGTRKGRGRSRRRRKFRLRSSKGGSHSIKLTVAGFDKLVEDETRKLTAGDA